MLYFGAKCFLINSFVGHGKTVYRQGKCWFRMRQPQMIICALHKLRQDCPSDEQKHAEAASVEAKPLAGLNHPLRSPRWYHQEDLVNTFPHWLGYCLNLQWCRGHAEEFGWSGFAATCRCPTESPGRGERGVCVCGNSTWFRNQLSCR